MGKDGSEKGKDGSEKGILIFQRECACDVTHPKWSRSQSNVIICKLCWQSRSAYRGTYQEFVYVTRFRFECSFRVIRLQTVQIHNISSSLSRFSVQVRLQRRLFSTIARYYIISVKSSQHKTYLKSLTKKSACEDMFSVKDLVVALSKLQSDAVNMYRWRKM